MRPSPRHGRLAAAGGRDPGPQSSSAADPRSVYRYKALCPRAPAHFSHRDISSVAQPWRRPDGAAYRPLAQGDSPTAAACPGMSRPTRQTAPERNAVRHRDHRARYLVRARLPGQACSPRLERSARTGVPPRLPVPPCHDRHELGIVAQRTQHGIHPPYLPPTCRKWPRREMTAPRRMRKGPHFFNEARLVRPWRPWLLFPGRPGHPGFRLPRA